MARRSTRGSRSSRHNFFARLGNCRHDARLERDAAVRDRLRDRNAEQRRHGRVPKSGRGARKLDGFLGDFDLGASFGTANGSGRSKAKSASHLRHVFGSQVLLCQPPEHHVQAAAHRDRDRGAPLVPPWIIDQLVGQNAALAAVIALLAFGIQTGAFDQRRARDDLEHAGGRRSRAYVDVEALALIHVAGVREQLAGPARP